VKLYVPDPDLELIRDRIAERDAVRQLRIGFCVGNDANDAAKIVGFEGDTLPDFMVQAAVHDLIIGGNAG
jgi:hypothetical protein